jgi:hypothetical protein
MVSIIGICANQSEEINQKLPKDAVNNPYHIRDILPGGVADLGEEKYKTGLRDGSWVKMTPLIGRDSPAFNTIDEVVWKGEDTGFGNVVRFIKRLG